MQQIDWKKLFLLFTFVILLIGSISSIFLYFQYRKTKDLLKNPQATTKEQTADLVKEVGKIIELPQEEPTVATVLDKNKLADQPFFNKAENGDKVLVFTQAKKAIIYRPSLNKIIEVSTINLGDTAGASTSVTPTNGKDSLSPSPRPTRKPVLSPTITLTEPEPSLSP